MLAAPLAVIVVRAALLFFAPAGVSLGLVLALDFAVLIVMFLAELLGGVFAGGFGTTALTFVGVGLPVAGLGALVESLAGREASNLSGMLSLLAMGVGFCLAAPLRAERFEQGMVLLIGMGTFALGTNLLVESRDLPAAAWLGAPYAVAALIALGLLTVRSRP
mgnify:CR=1 FL=1